MTRSLLVVASSIVLAGLVGCSGSHRDSEFPDRPIVIEDRERDRDDRDDRDEETRRTALRIFAAEQRSALESLDDETRFVRASSGTARRVREAIVTTSRALGDIEHDIATLDRSMEDMSRSEIRERQDDLKDRLRRVATRVSNIELAVRR
ncbi:MAG: hypothetical protein KF819_26370 [Labilithrix sp.]|nr:hypothetical protein [Labilithrix sp.]